MAGFMTATAPAPIVRQGNTLVIPANHSGGVVVLPRVCVRCGAAANGRPVTKNFGWHHPGLYVLLISPLIYVIVAVIVQKRMRIRVPLCAQHAQRRSLFVTLAWVLPLIGIADVFVLSRLNVDGGLVGLICVALVLAGLVVVAVVSHPTCPGVIDPPLGRFT